MDFQASQGQYETNKSRLQQFERIGVASGMRFHVLSAVCLAYEMYMDVEANKRFYSPLALRQLLDQKPITATVKYPEKNKHKPLSQWLDPDNQKDSIVYHVKMVAQDLLDLKRGDPIVIDISPKDIDYMKRWVGDSFKALRKDILPAYDFIFLSDAVKNLCDCCRDVLYLECSYRPIEELMLPLNDFRNDICNKLDYIEDRLFQAAREQKAKEKQKRIRRIRGMSEEELDDSLDPELHKEEQWKLFMREDMIKKHPYPGERERAVLRKIQYPDGYKPRSMVRKLNRARSE